MCNVNVFCWWPVVKRIVGNMLLRVIVGGLSQSGKYGKYVIR
jgi:hypothetical protein